MTAAAFVALSVISLVLAAVQVLSLRAHLRARARAPQQLPFMSLLKPLCGVDDDLRRNLRSFARLDYPRYEVLLGVKDELDAAWPIALEAAHRWPGLMRVVLQRGSPGLNPKVNQLITLSAAARGPILVVNDSNVRVRRDYLKGIAAAFDDERVALVTHPVAGAGERSLGALFDNLQMCGAIAPGIVAAARLAGKDLVVGKSMALRRSDLDAMGGFERLKDVLAEDFLSGRIVVNELGKRVAIAPTPVINVARTSSAGAFFSRYLRWSVMQRKAVGNAPYLAQLMLHPVALATIAAAIDQAMLPALAAVVLIHSALHEISARTLRGYGFGLAALAAPAADLIVACAWAIGLFRSEVAWRGNRLIVQEGTRLARAPESLLELPAAQ